MIAAEPRDSRAGLSHPGLGEDDLYELGPCLARSGDPLVGELWLRHLRRFESILARAAPGAVWDETVRRRDRARRILRSLG